MRMSSSGELKVPLRSVGVHDPYSTDVTIRSNMGYLSGQNPLKGTARGD